MFLVSKINIGGSYTPHEKSITVNCNLNPSNKGTDCITELKNFRLKNNKSIVTGHVNINSLKNSRV